MTTPSPRAEIRPPMYAEKTLQQAAIRWLSEHRGYSELLSDEEATGDRVDSVGLMDDRIHLVEVKPVMHAGVARHAGDRPGSIESKIAGVLRAIHEGAGPSIKSGAWELEPCPPAGCGDARHLI